MSEYLNNTEEQQFNEAKKWFQKNGTPIVVALFIAAASTFGWNYWKNHQAESAQISSAKYQAVMETYLQDPAKNNPLVNQFVQDHQGSNYAVFAQLEQAKQAVEQQDFALAKSTLQQALSGTDNATLHNVIRFRIAQVDYQLQQYSEALASLAQIQDKAWELRKQILTGDILAASGDKTAAKSAYEQAKQNASLQEQTMLDVRLNNL